MLQEAHTWSTEKQERWRKTREKGCWNYVLKVAAIALLAGGVVSAIYSFVTLTSSREFELVTALVIPVLGLVSGLITGRAYWGLSEDSFQRLRSR